MRTVRYTFLRHNHSVENLNLTRRKRIHDDVRSLLLTQCGYKCGNPNCRGIITLEIHHLDYVSDGGGNEIENLLPLCPTCHSLHHAGHIPQSALLAWKTLLDALSNPTRNILDLLILLYRDTGVAELPSGNVVEINKPRDNVPFVFSGDSLPLLAGPINSGLLEIFNRCQNSVFAGGSTPNFMIRLTSRGEQLVRCWLNGNFPGIRQLLADRDTGPRAESEP